jgi:hypothetical protein
VGAWTRLFVAAIALMACFMVAGDAGAAKKQKKAKPAVPKNEMTFTIMRASEAACEPECPQWIAASGDITPRTPGRLRTALKATGKAKLPIVISSPGGSVEAALAMGAMIRERKLTVAVGTSLSRGCAVDDDACKAKPGQSTVYNGVISGVTAYCNSACTLVLASGSLRIASDWDTIGVHQILTTPRYERVYYRETYRIINGKKKVLSHKVTGRKIITGKATTKLDKGFRRKLSAYVKRMGVGQAYLDLYESAAPADIHNMTSAERRATKIVTMPMSAQGLTAPTMCKGSVHAPHCVARKPKAG